MMRSRDIHFVGVIVGICLCAVILRPAPVSAGKKCDSMVEEYVLTITRISIDVSDSGERDRLQKEALKDLIRYARSIYGLFCPCDEFLNRAEALRKHRENWRSPPPGWEPAKFRAEFLPLESEIAHEDIRLLMQLMGLCDRH